MCFLLFLLFVLSSAACSPGSTDAAPTCSDGLRNGGETDVDCGGGCGPCRLDEGCTTADDCASQQCVSGKCVECAADSQCSIQGAEWHCVAHRCRFACDAANPSCPGSLVCKDGFCVEAG